MVSTQIDQKDIVFATVPYTDTNIPLMAPAILKSIASKAGKTSVTIDLNIQAINFIETHPYKHEIILFFHDGLTISEIEKDLFELHLKFAKQLLAYKPKIIGLSVFTYNCQTAARYLTFFIKKLSPDTKVILGGNGLIDNLVGPAKFADALVKSKLIDFYIRGDSEKVLYEYLINERTNITGINTDHWDTLSNEELINLPMPDYDDYNMDDYSDKVIPILGSRGCVRKCSFCDIHAHWTKFSYRTGQHIFDEMLLSSKKYNIYHFMFQDSLINGNLREYRELMTLIANYNKNVDDSKKFKWTSFWIMRSVNTFTEEDWRLTAEGGGKWLLVGIETFSDSARFHIGKKFTNEDIEFGLKMARKYNIKMVFLFLVGYITETEEDIDYAVKWWKDHVEYRDILQVNLGSPLGILHQTPLQKNFIELKLEKVGPHDQDWVNPATGNTPIKRVEWYERLSATVARLGFIEHKPTDNRFIMERIVKDFQ